MHLQMVPQLLPFIFKRNIGYYFAMKLFVIFYFTYIVLVDIIFCNTSNSKSSIDSAENQFVYPYNDYLPLIGIPPVKTLNVKSRCSYFDENSPNCGYVSDETRQKASKVANRPNLMNL